jgi:glycosyltransferase involved in cell wall biosynthesis
LAGRFVLLGERQDVPALLPGFDVFAMSSLYEGLPCAVVEAMTCGVPVVATAVNSVPEVVVAGKTGLLVPTRDPASLARAMAYLLDHPDEAGQMAHEARLRLGNRFCAETLGRDLAAVYDLALRRPTVMASASLASATPA